MDKFQAMQVFIAVVEQSSFTRAAEQLQMPRASVTLSIKQLETHLGTRLLQRTTRQVNTTADGDAYYQRCVRLLADLEETESAFSHSLLNPRGKLRINLQGSLGKSFVVPALPGFSAKYPLIELEVGMSDRLVDLVREGVDCVLRGGELRDSSMIAKRVALMTQITCASSSYLQKHGVPSTLDDLSAHLAVNYFSSQTGRNMDFEFVIGGKTQTLPLKGQLAVNDVEAYVAGAEAGYGLIQLPRFHVAAQLAAGSMQEVLPELRPPPMPVSILYPHHRQLSPRVRVFVEWLTELMQKHADKFKA